MKKLTYIFNSTGKKVAVSLAALGASGSAFADLPAVVGTSLTAIQTDALALVDLLWPVIVAIVTAFILVKIFKRGASKI